MSSFGSSLINKSGKKVLPKAAGRRKPGTAGPPSATIPEASSIESSLTTTSQLDLLAVKAAPNATAGGSDESAAQPTDVSPALGDESSHVQASEQREASSGPPRLSAQLQSKSSAQNLPTAGSLAIQDTALLDGSTIAESIDPDQQSRPVKRRRIESEPKDKENLADSTGTLPPSSPFRAPTIRYDDEEGIPRIVTRKRTPPTSTTSKSAASRPEHDGAEDDVADGSREQHSNGLVSYETPHVIQENLSQQSSRTRTRPRPAVAPILSTSIPRVLPKRNKGTRRQQWQITTQADLASAQRRALQSPEPSTETGAGEADPDAAAAPKQRKVRKDKGIKKRPIFEGVDAESEEETGLDSPEAATAGADAPEEAPATASGTTSARIRNAQKRREKKMRVNAIQSRIQATQTAAIIDNAVAQTLQAQSLGRPLRAAPISPKPVLRRTRELARSRSNSTPASDVTDSANGSIENDDERQSRKRQKRGPTPEANETVFIAEKVTPMFSLVGRDTESRVGRRSLREMKMREIDWAEVKRERKEQERARAIAKGKRRSNIFDDMDNPNDLNGGSNAGDIDENASDMSEGEELDRLVARREAQLGRADINVRIVNGEHRIDDRAASEDPADEIERAMQAQKAVLDDDLTKSFNVQTYSKWKRREPLERVYQSSRWSEDETERFYDALLHCGTDFGAMLPWFPGRIRRALKRKFNQEEKLNGQRIDATLRQHAELPSRGDGEGWDLERFHAEGMPREGMVDPRELDQELLEMRVEKEKEIEEARKETAELKRQEELHKKMAGTRDEDEEEDEEMDDEMQGGGDEFDPARIREALERKRMAREASQDGGEASGSDVEGGAADANAHAMDTTQNEDEGEDE